ARFVGASTLRRRTGRTFTLRPEKIRMTNDGGTRRDDDNAATGRIRDVVYAGMFTRYVVDLDDGGELVVVRQNLETSSTEALDARGRRVLLEWKAQHAIETKPEREENHDSSSSALPGVGGRRPSDRSARRGRGRLRRRQ